MDPITFELVRRTFEGLCDEMARTLARAAFSPILRNANDFATALLNRDGEVVAQGATNPIHMLSFNHAAHAVRDAFGPDIRPGDVFALNDPYAGGSHLPDLFLLKPVFVDDGHVGYVGAEAHHCDVGGRVAGSNAADSSSIYEEGLRIPPIRLVEEGREVPAAIALLRANSRLPEQVYGDLCAQLAALRLGEMRFTEAGRVHGWTSVLEHMSVFLDYGERMARAEIATWPDGEWTYVDWLDDDGLSTKPIPIAVTIEVRNDEVEVRFEGSGPQAQSAINAPLGYTTSCVVVALRCGMRGDIPHNSGYARPITVGAPAGSVVNPVSPAAVSARAVTGCRVFDAMLGCMANIVPSRVMAGTEGGNHLITFAGVDATGAQYIFTDSHSGSWGARPDRDAVDGICSPLVAARNTPVEVIERDTPLMIRRYEYVSDTCGAGEFRGGLAMTREYELLEGTAVVHVRSDRVNLAPPGFAGGMPGRVAENAVVRHDGTATLCPSKHSSDLAAGEAYRATTAGAGGWGHPFDRTPESVLSDVLEEKISRDFALQQFGVDVNQTLELETARTSEARRARGPR